MFPHLRRSYNWGTHLGEAQMSEPHRTPGPLGGSSSGSTGRRPGPVGHDPRAQAKALGAADAQSLVRTALPSVFEHVTSAQWRQIQKVLDAAVVDPIVKAEADAFYAQSVTHSGSLTFHDAALVRRSDRAMEHYIYVTEADKRIRLDFTDLIDPNALKPVTDNPDEAAYLEKVRKTLVNKGVWLRFAPKLVRDREDPSRHVLDARSFDVWLSLGPNGDTIPTKDGRLTRDTLLGTTLFGAGYYRQVDQGAVQRELDKEVRRLRSQIETGLQEHQRLAKVRRDAFPGIAEVSDLLGGADFPAQSIWDDPYRFVLKAMQLNVGGNVKASQAYLVTAAIITRNAANLLASYVEDTTSGAQRAVTVLKVAKTAGEVAEIGLAVTGVTGLVRGGMAIAGEAGAAEIDQAAERLVKRYVAENPEIAGDLNNVRWVPGPKGSVAGGIKPGTSSGAGTGWHRW